jgi:hypothetical protein
MFINGVFPSFSGTATLHYTREEKGEEGLKVTRRASMAMNKKKTLQSVTEPKRSKSCGSIINLTLHIFKKAME